jgi:hypothetical protein
VAPDPVAAADATVVVPLGSPARRSRWAARLPLLVAISAAVANTAGIGATLTPVAYLDDASMHEQMVRYATAYLGSGRNPLRGWWPYLGLGSPQFLHYQSLGAMLTGLAGLAVGADAAFRWSLLLLWGAWPLVVYASARIWGFGRCAAAGAAVVAPLLSSVPSVGYERGAYLWIGYGLWSQLCASWFLPLAWATSWRAVGDRRYTAPAVVCIALTAELHFETGYLALLAPMLWPWIVPADLRARLRRAAVVLGLSLVAASWALLPLVLQGRWASINEVFVHSPLEQGYGAGVVLSWLVDGRMLDNGHLPTVTVLALAGVGAVARRWRRDPTGRSVALIGVASLLLSFGPTTWGVLMDAVPGSHDLFFRRFMLGAQLAAVLLAGIGAQALVRATAAGAAGLARRVARSAGEHFAGPLPGRNRAGRRGISPERLAARASAVVALLAVALALVPAVSAVRSYDRANAANIAAQRREQAVAGRSIAPIIARIRRLGGGRTYAGAPDNWGATFTVGQVPVFKYLESQDIQEVGYTLRTASLMTDPEVAFDPANPGDFSLFGIRWLIYPAGLSPPAGARPVRASGPYRLWELPANGWLEVLDTVGVLRANRADVGRRSVPLLDGSLLDRHRDLAVAWAGSQAATLTDPGGADGTGSPGVVRSDTANLVDGLARGVVHLTRRAVVVLSASYDPGWQATVDGHPAQTQMIAPAVVGVSVPAGTHVVAFRYDGFGGYPELFALSAAGVTAALLVGITGGRRRARTDRLGVAAAAR